jgi:2-methylcitrate dehydratase PrpD
MTCNDDAGVTRLVSEQAASLTYEALPRELVELIKQIVLDTLGVAKLAGARRDRLLDLCRCKSTISIRLPGVV